ncbi:hypothetical protein JKP88DRAFT_249375 [Tribonema minus]|uniref:Uncharacterized protein n=1 Tax=Tribonema minus TaxID=303371 RepID=A0A836C8P9_9STRA|nr:hypothetical protein JKP88DRAFT_249375 [Tribonema minus]
MDEARRQPERTGNTDCATKYALVYQTCAQGGRPTYSATLRIPRTVYTRDDSLDDLPSLCKFSNWPSVAGVVNMRNKAAQLLWKKRITEEIAALKKKYNIADPIPMPEPAPRAAGKRKATQQVSTKASKARKGNGQQLALAAAAPAQQLTRKLGTMQRQLIVQQQCIKSLKDTQLELAAGQAHLTQRQGKTAQLVDRVANVHQGLIAATRALQARDATTHALVEQLAAASMKHEQQIAKAIEIAAAAQQRGIEAADAAAAAAQVAAAAQGKADETAYSTSKLAKVVDVVSTEVIKRLAQLD